MKIVETEAQVNQRVPFVQLVVGEIFWCGGRYYRKRQGDTAHRMDARCRVYFKDDTIVTRIPDEDVELHVVQPREVCDE